MRAITARPFVIDQDKTDSERCEAFNRIQKVEAVHLGKRQINDRGVRVVGERSSPYSLRALSKSASTRRWPPYR
jgi:hypothetical protein